MLKLKNLKPDENGFVRVRRSKRCRKTYKWKMTFDEAVVHVKEGSASVIDVNTIYKYRDNKHTRLQVLKRDKNICHYCGKFGDTVDHKTPLTKGGYTTPMNLVCSCLRCNQLKGLKNYQDYINEIKRK